jgi:hypothetical protein
MRCLLKIVIPVETGNQGIMNGTLPTTIEAILAEQNPEAVYFYEEDGKRTGLVVLDIKDSSQIPAIAEPWFLAFNARVEFHPAMNLQDLNNSAPGMQKAVQNHRKMNAAAG